MSDLEEAPPVVDLRTLLGEMAGLKMEIRAETQASRALRTTVDEGSAALKAALERAQTQEVQGRRGIARALIDIADRLHAALRSARRPAPRGLFWRRPDPRVEALADGLSMTAARLTEHLGTLGVRAVRAQGCAFDPETMEAVGTVSRGDLADGLVVEEITTGYVDEAGTVRVAQVTVNRAAPLLEE